MYFSAAVMWYIYVYVGGIVKRVCAIVPDKTQPKGQLTKWGTSKGYQGGTEVSFTLYVLNFAEGT